MQINLDYIGIITDGTPFFIDNVDITKILVENVLRHHVFCKPKVISINDIYIKIGYYKNGCVFFGERTSKGIREIFALDDSYKIKLYSYVKFYDSPSEINVKKELSFLLDYNFTYKKIEFKNALDKKGKFFFYGPVGCYCFYNDKVCINIVHLVQRDEYDIYITAKFTNDQVYIRNGYCCEDRYSYDMASFADCLKSSIVTSGRIFDYPIE